MAVLPRVLVLTALKKEFKAIADLAGTEFKERVHPAGTVYSVGAFPAKAPKWELVLAETGRGGGRAGDEAHRGIAFLQPRIVLMLGVAGGLKDVRRGDVVAATKVYHYESGKLGNTGDGEAKFYPRPEIGESSHSLVQRARAEARSGHWRERIADEGVSTPEAMVEPIATGAKVVATKGEEVYSRLAGLYSDAVALDMESYDVLRVAYSSGGIDCLAVRGISDLLVGKTEDDEAGGQEAAARNAAAFVLAVLENLDPDRYILRHPGELDELGTRIMASDEVNPILEELGNDVDTYCYRGHLGRYPRTAVAGKLIETALASGTGPRLIMQLILIDPADDMLLEAYAAHRRTQGLDAQLSTADAVRRVRNEILATVVRMYVWKDVYPNLSVDIRFTRHLSLIRIDLCSKLALITKDNPFEPMIVLRPQSAFYKTFKDEVELTAQQARKLLEGLPGVRREGLDSSRAIELLRRLGVGVELSSGDGEAIVAMAFASDPPYGRPKLGPAL